MSIRERSAKLGLPQTRLSNRGVVRVLADTHALVWALSDPDLLSGPARQVLGESEVVVSIASLWELLLKGGKKDALLQDPLPWWEKYVVQSRIPTLAIRTSHVVALGRLPESHKDPFDRILVAQAIVERMPLVTKDDRLQRYGIATIW
ncbi:MAG TPA: type II toxin-antitoxin system VapC family toxin [Bryobacteraceae bacterium]|nr:type II toxin-antitoxin system VapC family toxin [Bryobacteraceae bacterium]